MIVVGYSQSQAEALVVLLTRSLQTSVSSLVSEHVKRHELVRIDHTTGCVSILV